MNLSSVVERIRDLCPLLRSVGGAAQYDVAVNGLLTAPAAFVVPLSETAGENYLASGATAQRIEVRFGVILVLSSHGDVTQGADALDQLDTHRSALRAALHGWLPSPDAEPCLVDQGAVLEFLPGELWWQDVYRTAYDLRTMP